MSIQEQTRIKELDAEVKELQYQLFEARETIEAIRTGQIDALVIDEGESQALYTLKTADQTYRVFIEKMTEGALTLNYNGIILYCNLQFAQMVGLSISDIIGMPLNKFIARELVSDFEKMLGKAWANDLKAEIALSFNGHTIPVQLSLTALELEKEVALSVILTDLSTQKQAQRQLEETNIHLEELNRALERSNHDLQQFASVASHDLQEPLRKIQIFSNLLISDSSNKFTPEAQQYLQKIMDSSTRMKNLIVDVLNYSKLSAVSNEFVPVDLNEVVREVLEDFELTIREKQASIVVGRLPVVEGIKGQIRQMFQNVISNALKFSRPGTPPLISIQATPCAERSLSAAPAEDGPFSLIAIKDNGIGFDEKYLSNMFTLFECLHSKDAYEGTGIGLAITKKIIEKHNGLVTARSHPDEGAEFLLLLCVKQN